MNLRELENVIQGLYRSHDEEPEDIEITDLSNIDDIITIDTCSSNLNITTSVQKTPTNGCSH